MFYRFIKLRFLFVKTDENSYLGFPEMKLKDWIKENIVTYDTI